MMGLQSKRHILTSLVDSIAAQSPSAQDDTNANPLKALSVSEQSKKVFLTLHVLFPNELLPALDLLDRGLVTRFSLQPLTSEAHITGPSAQHGSTTAHNIAAVHQPNDIHSAATTKTAMRSRTYYVRSAQSAPSSSRFHHRDRYTNNDQDRDRERDPRHQMDIGGESSNSTLDTHYQVKPAAWNCSCPAFVFAAFPASTMTAGTSTSTRADVHSGETDEGQREWWAGGLSLGEDVPVCKHLLACVLAEHCEAIFGRFVQVRVASLKEIAGWDVGWGG